MFKTVKVILPPPHQRRSSMNIVPSNFKTAIKPSDIIIAKNAPAMMAMMDTLDKCEYEATAASFVVNSQDAGKWIGFIYEDRAEGNTNFAKMVELGFLAEQQIDTGWLYELTQFAIEQIYVRQSKRQIHHLKVATVHAHGTTFLRRLRKLFSPAPAFA